MKPVSRTWTNTQIELFVLHEEAVTEDYVNWLNDPLVNQFLESRFVHHTLETTRQFVKQCAANERVLLLGIRTPLLEHQHVGNIKLEINPPHGLGEIGIMIGEKRVWGKGLACEAIRMLVGISRDELNLRKLVASCYGSNVASQRAFEKAGFVVEGARPAQFLNQDKPEAMTLMGMLL